MALRFVDSFDHYATANIGKKWPIYTAALISASGRNGSCAEMASNDVMAQVFDSQATWIVGFAFNVDSYASASTGAPLLRFKDTAVLHFDLRINSAGKLLVTRNGTILTTGTTTLTEATWYYIETKVTIGDAGAGSYQVKLNGADEIHNAGGVVAGDTRNAGNASANRIELGEFSGASLLFDDLYMCDGAGATNNDFLGDCRVEALLPSGAGNAAQFTPSAGSNYQNVDDAAADGDTTYNASSTSGHIDSFAMGNLTMTSGTIYGVQTNLWARKDDAGTRGLKPHFRISATDYARTTVNLTDTYLDRLAIEETNPNTAAAWDVGGVNGAEFGYKVP